jgi:hypothetical protein
MTAKYPIANNGATSLLQWVWRSYFRAALIPLLLVEVAFIAIYLAATHLATQENIAAVRAIATEELRRIAQRESVVIQQQLAAISRITDLFRRQTVPILATPFDPGPEERNRYAYSPEGVYYTTRDNGGGALFYSGAVPVGPKQREKAWRTARLDPLMRDIQQIHPLVAQIYFNTFDSLNRIYPYFEVLSQYAPRMDIPTYNFYYEADAAHNPGRGVVWTDVYVDPAGQGWMVSCIAPVYRDDFLEGVVGLDITVGTITDTILNLAIPWNGYGVLVSKTGTLLALPRAGEDDWGLKELTTHAYTDAIRQDTFKPEEFNIYRRAGFAGLQNQPEGEAALDLKGAQLAAWATIPETGWKLVVLVRESSIYAQANELGRRLFVIGAWMVGGIISCFICFFSSFSTGVPGSWPAPSPALSKPLMPWSNESAKATTSRKRLNSRCSNCKRPLPGWWRWAANSARSTSACGWPSRKPSRPATRRWSPRGSSRNSWPRSVTKSVRR